ncbi:hypothetical protein PFISCL1PPCAC_21548, partial [Pristionchus fissidentatus]
RPEMKSLSKCESCMRNVSDPGRYKDPLATPSYILICGHVICDECRENNLNENGDILCRFCGYQTESTPMPSKREADSSPCFIKSGKFCIDHSRAHSLRCSCGKTICAECAKSSHATHFPYAELLEMTNELDEEAFQMKRQKSILYKEKDK